MNSSLLFLHLFFAMVWIGGMVYSLLFLAPSAKAIKNEETRKELLTKVLGRFFLAVWLSIIVLLLSGLGMWHSYRPDLSSNPLFHTKLFLFTIMVLNFIYIHLFLFKRGQLKPIPNLVWVNLLLGTLITMIISYIRLG